MVIRNKTTFDPYSVGDFRVRDAFWMAKISWREHRSAFIFLGLLASLPTLVGFWWAPPWLCALVACASLIILAGLVGPMVARQARGLNTDFRQAGNMLFARLAHLVIVGGLIVGIVQGLALLFGMYESALSYVGLFLGALCVGPLLLAVPVIVIENLGLIRSLRRGFFLVKGRVVRATLLLAFGVVGAVLPGALASVAPVAAGCLLVVQPLILSWCSICVGALYTSLYDH
ncbi:MAG: hypothetical protein ACON3Z_02230 [Bradymonadia bacterium]